MWPIWIYSYWNNYRIVTKNIKIKVKIFKIFNEKKLRISRILKRDSYRTKDQIEHIIKSQLTDKESFEKADYILENNEKSLLLPEVIDLYEKIRKKAC